MCRLKSTAENCAIHHWYLKGEAIISDKVFEEEYTMSYKNMPEKKKNESVEEWLDKVEKVCPEMSIPDEEKPVLDINAINDFMEEME